MVLIIGLGLWWWRGQSAKKQAEAEKRVVEVQKKDVVRTLSTSGKVEAKKKAVLNFSVSGKLGFVRVEEGDTVTKGEWLMGVDIGDLQIAERTAYYTYLAADANAHEVEDDLKGHDKDETFAQKNERVAAQTVRDKAYDAWLLAQRTTQNAILKAPFGGIVTEMTTQVVGDTVGMVDGVTVVDPSELYFETEVDEADVGKLTIGQKVKVELDAFDGEEFWGILEEIGFAARTSSTGATVFPARIMFESGTLPRLRLGMNGDAEVETARVSEAVSVAIEAIVDGEVELESGEKIKVEVGIEGDNEVEVKGGLKEGDKVVIK